MSSWPAPSPSVASPAYDLRPLSLGEVLDRTFTVYRRNFWLIAGISSLSGLVQLVSGLLQVLLGYGTGRTNPQSLRMPLLTVGVSILFALLFLLVSCITQAATVFALTEVYLGRTTSIGTALRTTLADWWKFPLIGLWQFASGAWPMLLVVIPGALMAVKMRGQRPEAFAYFGLLVLVAIPLGIVGYILYLRNALAVPVQVVEHPPSIRSAMKRSKILTPGAKATLFVLALLCGALYFAGSAVIGIVAVIFGVKSHADLAHPNTTLIVAVQLVSLAVQFLVHTVIIPVILVGTAVVYFNQRVKKEGFDLLFLLGQGGGPVPAAPEPSPFGFSTEASPFGISPTPPPSIASEPYPYNLTPEPSAFSLSTETTPIYPPPAAAQPPTPPEPSTPEPTTDDEPLP